MTVPAGVVALLPLVPPFTPASSLPGPGVSGAFTYQLPGPSWTLISRSAAENSRLMAALSVAPVVSPDGVT